MIFLLDYLGKLLHMLGNFDGCLNEVEAFTNAYQGATL